MKSCFLLTVFLFLKLSINAFSQDLLGHDEAVFARADSLRGTLTSLRACYDVTFYHLNIKIDPSDKSISGFNTIFFSTVTPFSRMQIDLFPNMKIDSILFEDGRKCNYEREYGAVFITLPEELKSGNHSIRVHYNGNPQVAKRPPWDGGFTWTEDEDGNPWVVVTCQRTGASLWWPNKDHQSDEPDSMLMSITVPPGLEDVSNGRLRGRREEVDGWTTFDWFIYSPINNYNVTVNIGKLVHFSDEYVSTNGEKLTLDYYVLRGNAKKAKKQFEVVGPMLRTFEHYFGKYPFYRDGFKLIDAPHNGMEHQTAIAYGNNYLKGYDGYSSSKVGLNFDFIIVHESAHEWWGNHVTAKDIADMWIHESFGAYAEALFVEDNWGYDASLEYINAKKQNVLNNKPILGPFGVNTEGSSDMYDKGQLILNTLRNVIDNDSLWFSILRGIQETFSHKSVDGKEIIDYINERTGENMDYFFDQYLKFKNLPRFDAIISAKGDRVTLRYRWKADVDFRMPLKVTISTGRYEFIRPTMEWQEMELNDIDAGDFRIAEDHFYCDKKISRIYTDPDSP
ncbi:MAG TPA: M1 family metallopeptidase [Cyclobacteriaceae bacterium]|nr:M1 family metallopeptidase [Cyclobacteriaceae bacterium]